MTKELAKCNTLWCDGKVRFSYNKSIRKSYTFCRKCRNEHSFHALVIQVKHEKPIIEVINEARMFGSASRMSDFIGVSFVTMYHWIKKYYEMTFQQFRRTYICKSDKCYLLDIKRSSYSRHDYILKKIRDKRYCACINALEKDHIMTNAPMSVISSILVGRPTITKISDNLFAVVPSPVRFSNELFPIYELSD